MSGKFLFVLAAVVAAVAHVAAQTPVEDNARQFLKWFDDNATVLVYDSSLASWAYNTNITAENADKVVSLLLMTGM